MYLVDGGEFVSTEFRDLEPGKGESYGPFKKYDDAYRVWSSRARAKIDICCHRLFIHKV